MVKGRGAAARSLFPVILHANDLSERSRHAFDLACTLARGGGRLNVLHVVEVVHIGSEGYEQALYERLHMFQTDDPSIKVEYWLREGDPAAEILSEAAAKGCGLIALGSHGSTGLDQLLTGSVAQTVIKGAECPVLATRIRAEEPTSLVALHQEQHA